MSLFLKRDEEGTRAPSPDQLGIGELVVNSVTGKLYTKIITGDIIEYIGQKVCFNSVPEVTFSYENNSVNDLLNNFCCAGGMIVATVNKLKLEPASYSFTIVELTNNTTQNNITVNEPEYNIYTASGISYRQAIIPVSLSINSSSYKNISLFKFNIFLDSIKISETLLTIKCLEANN
jgi:hypothetical protein